jgi:hypothetical protein
MSTFRVAALVGAAVAIAGAHRADAAIFQVTNHSDAVPAPAGSFRAALNASNATPLTLGVPHRIQFTMAAAGTIFPIAPFTVSRAVRIEGNNKVTFNSDTGASIPVDGHSVFTVQGTHRMEMWDAILLGRKRQRGIYVAPAGFLETWRVRISGFKDPEDQEPGYGAGVFCEGGPPGTPWGPGITSCHLRRTRIDGCVADWGAGLAGYGAVNVSLNWSDVHGNIARESGGGVLVFGTESVAFESALWIDQTSLRNNVATWDGGAVAAVGVSYVVLVNSTVSANTTQTQHRAASLLLDTIPDLRVIHSTIVNGAGPAGGPSNGNALQIARATGYVRNSVIGQTGNLNGNQCTLGPNNVVTFANDIVKDASCGPAATANLGLLSLTASACGNYAPASLTGCMVHPLLSVSPARDFASAQYCAPGYGTNVDQREYTRPGTCDAGAYEYDGVP